MGTVSKQDISLCGKPLPSSGFVGCYKWELTSPSFCKCTATGTRQLSADPKDLLGFTNEKNSLFIIEIGCSAFNFLKPCLFYLGLYEVFYLYF